MSADDQCLDPRRDQRGAVGVVNHLARCLQLFAQSRFVEPGETDAGGFQRSGIHPDGFGAFLMFAVCVLAFLVLGVFVVVGIVGVDGLTSLLGRSRDGGRFGGVGAAGSQRECQQRGQRRVRESQVVHRGRSPFASVSPSQRSSWPVAAR